MRSSCRPFIQPDNAIKTNRNGSKRCGIANAIIAASGCTAAVFHKICRIEFPDTTGCYERNGADTPMDAGGLAAASVVCTNRALLLSEGQGWTGAAVQRWERVAAFTRDERILDRRTDAGGMSIVPDRSLTLSCCRWIIRLY